MVVLWGIVRLSVIAWSWWRRWRRGRSGCPSGWRCLLTSKFAIGADLLGQALGSLSLLLLLAGTAYVAVDFLGERGHVEKLRKMLAVMLINVGGGGTLLSCEPLDRFCLGHTCGITLPTGRGIDRDGDDLLGMIRQREPCVAVQAWLTQEMFLFYYAAQFVLQHFGILGRRVKGEKILA